MRSNVKSSWNRVVISVAALAGVWLAAGTAWADYMSTVLADNPVAYWRLGETGGDGTTVYDSADAGGSPQQGAQNGTFIRTNPSNGGLGYDGPQSPTYLGFEADNLAPRFRGSSGYNVTYVNAGNPAPLQITGVLTLEAWVYPEELISGRNLGIMAKLRGDSAAQNQRAYSLYIDGNGELTFSLSPDGTASASSNLHSSTVLPMNTWVHVAAVYVPGTSMKIYLDGALDVELTSGVPASIHNSTAEFWIGMQYSVNNLANFRGRIDEAAVYNTALSGPQIEAHYQAGHGPRAWHTGAVGHWPDRPAGLRLEEAEVTGDLMVGVAVE